MTKKSTPQQIARVLEIVRVVLAALDTTRDALQRVVLNSAFPDRFRELVLSIANEYFVLLTDEEAIDWLVKRARKSLEEARQIVAGWRQKARQYGLADKIRLHAIVHPGATFKRDIPQMGPCWEDFRYLQSWHFKDQPTGHALLSWVPIPLWDSTNKDVSEQMALVSAFKVEAVLPVWYQVSFGSVTHVAGLALVHSKATNQDAFNGLIVRTDSCSAGGRRLCLYRRDGRLFCDYWDWGGFRGPRIAVFAVGVVKALGR